MHNNGINHRHWRKSRTGPRNSELDSTWPVADIDCDHSYARLGLTHRLKSSTGGKEVNTHSIPSTNSNNMKHLQPNEAKIHRAPDGSILKIEYAEALRHETIGDSIEDLAPSRQEEEDDTDVVKALRERMTMGITKERLQSDREQDWIQRLVEKHGDDYQAMFWDKNLNIRQQSVGDIKKRVQKWKSKRRETIS